MLAELLSRATRVELPEHDAVTPVSESIGDALPRELRCDAVFCFRREHDAVLAAVLEVQLAEDGDKPFTWPAYLVGARLRFRCDAVLVVVTVSRSVAEWARQPIRLGPAAGHVQALVVGPDDVPAIVDPAYASENPELAVLSAIAHGKDPDVDRAATTATVAAAAVLGVLKGERSALYYDLIKASLSDAARKAFEMFPANYEYQDEGLRRAKAEGKAEGKAEAIVALLKVRGLSINEEQRRRILAATDLEQLDRWLLLAATATSGDAVFLQ